MKKHLEKHGLQWRVHMPNLLKEIAENSRDGQALTAPLQIAGAILYELGEIATRINDDELNAIMCRLTIYEIADPTVKGHDKKLTEKIIKKGRRKND